jgi:hypothetical protein
MTETKPLHECSGDLPSEGENPGTISCDECEDGSLWVTTAEGSWQVGYCPYCGYEAQAIPTLLMFRKIGVELK